MRKNTSIKNNKKLYLYIVLLMIVAIVSIFLVNNNKSEIAIEGDQISSNVDTPLSENGSTNSERVSEVSESLRQSPWFVGLSEEFVVRRVSESENRNSKIYTINYIVNNSQLEIENTLKEIVESNGWTLVTQNDRRIFASKESFRLNVSFFPKKDEGFYVNMSYHIPL
jgi:hypothetical protein